MFIRLLRRFVLLNAFEGEGGGGGVEAPAPVAVEPASAPAPLAEVVSAPAVVAPAVVKPTTMLDAITQGLEKTHPALTAPRDPTGKFVPKVATDVVPVDPTKPVAPIVPVVEAKPEDITAMPEGISKPAQERFAKLVSTNRELTEKYDQANKAVDYVKQTFSQHGIKQEQFEQAAGLIGMINKGDFEGAQRILQQQMQHIAVLSGKPLGQIDALVNYPDLRQAVDGMQITEQHAMEIAKARATSNIQQNQQQAQQRDQQTQAQERQAVQAGTNAVDAFCKRMQGSDMDYPAIEGHLVPAITDLLRGVQPQDWARVVEAQYNLIKKVAGSARPAPAAVSNPLRPTGHGSLAQAPKSMHEAMWGEQAPR